MIGFKEAALLLPVVFLVGVGLAGCAHGYRGPRVISPFGSFYGPEGYPRQEGPHNGIDVAGAIGDPVLAVTDGTVLVAAENHGDCGTIVVIRLTPTTRAVYCHLAAYVVSAGQPVKRGDVVGFLGTTGRRPGPGFEHIHLTLRVGETAVDPEAYMLGCFEVGRAYPADKLALTWPVRC